MIFVILNKISVRTFHIPGTLCKVLEAQGSVETRMYRWVFRYR